MFLDQILTIEDFKAAIYQALTEMAGDSTIFSLPSLVSQQSTDIYEVSANGAGSFKESRAQMLSYFQSNINLQNVYNASGSSPAIQLNSSGFFLKDPSSNTLLGISTSDGTHFSSVLSAQNVVSLTNLSNDGFAQFDGQSITNYIPVNKGVNNPNFTFTAQSIIPSNTFATAATYQFGFADESNSPSGFFKLNLMDQGSLNTLLHARGTASSNIPYVGVNGQLAVGVAYGSSTNKNAVLQASSTFQGFLPPSLTNSQESTLTGILGSGDAGLSWYNNTIGVDSYWDGTTRQQLLAISKITQGSNMIITKNSDGTVIFASSGGGGAGTQVQGTFTTASTSTTSVTTSDSPINIASPTYFNSINAVGTTVAATVVSGVTTATIQNTSTGARYGIARFDLTMSFTTSATTTFAFTVYTNTGATTFFKNATLTYTSGTNLEIGFASPLVLLNQNDYMYLAVSCATGSTSFTVRNFEGSWVDTTVASIPNSNALLQGSNNLFLSQNGGTTYQNISGTLTPGNLVQGNTAGGQLIDSGIASSSVVLNNSGTYNINISGNASTVTTNANLTGDVNSVGNASTLVASGISKVVAITTVSGTSQSMSDTAPINRYVLNNSSLCTLTLPASPTIGHTFEILGCGTQRWIIAQNASQFITTSVNGSIVSSTVGVSGNAGGSNNTDCMTLIYAGSNKFVIQSEQTSGTSIIVS